MEAHDKKGRPIMQGGWVRCGGLDGRVMGIGRVEGAAFPQGTCVFVDTYKDVRWDSPDEIEVITYLGDPVRLIDAEEKDSAK